VAARSTSVKGVAVWGEGGKDENKGLLKRHDILILNNAIAMGMGDKKTTKKKKSSADWSGQEERAPSEGDAVRRQG